MSHDTGSSSPAMKFNYNPNNLGLLPDIMSFEVSSSHTISPRAIPEQSQPPP